MVTENELHYLIATSDRIRTYAKISNLDDERDIDSLAMLIKEAYITKGFDTMYEILSWSEAYPNSLFPFPWKIADFVIEGKRREQPDELSNDQYDLIEK